MSCCGGRIVCCRSRQVSRLSRVHAYCCSATRRTLPNSNRFVKDLASTSPRSRRNTTSVLCRAENRSGFFHPGWLPSPVALRAPCEGPSMAISGVCIWTPPMSDYTQCGVQSNCTPNHATLGVRSVTAAPGIFFVFREESLRQSYLASRYHRHVALPRTYHYTHLFERYKELLQSLISFVATRGRLPEAAELDEAVTLREVFGSLRRVLEVVQRVTGKEQWVAIQRERA